MPQFKAIMNGGSVVAMVDSPCRVEMRKAVFWKGAFIISDQLMVTLPVDE